jgi:hypothetical protein
MLDGLIDSIGGHIIVKVVDEGPASLHPGMLLRSLSFMAINPLMRPRRYSSTKILFFFMGKINN